MLLVTTILCAALALVASSPALASSTLAKHRHARHDLLRAKLHLRQYRVLLSALLAAQVAADSGPGTTTTTEPTPVPSPTVSPSPDPSASPVPDPSPSATPNPEPTPVPSPTVSPSPDPGVSPTAAAPVTSLTESQVRTKIVRLQARVRRLRRTVRRFGHRLYVERATAKGNYMPLILDVARSNGISATGLYAMMRFESGGRRTAVGGGGAYLGLFQYCWSTWRAAWNPWRTSSIYDAAAQIRATARAVRLGYAPSMWPNTYWRAF